MAVSQEVNLGQNSPDALQVAEREAIARDLGLEKGKPNEKIFDVLAKDPELQKMAAEHARKLIAIANSEDAVAMNDAKTTVDTIGLNTQREASHKSHLLQEPIRQLSRSGEDGGAVAKSLVDLKFKVEELDPNKIDFSPGWFSRMLGFLPFFGKPLKRYFTQYESSQTVIAAIMNSLMKGREQLERDNTTLAADQAAMRNLTKRLEKVIAMTKLMEKQIAVECSRLEDGTSQKQYLQEEILYPIRQRIIDLQTQLTVNLQGILAIEIIIRNNRELIRGVRRAENVTISALEVAVTVSVALAHQQIVLDKLIAVNKTTDDLILKTSERLKTQGVKIHKQASSAQLQVETLKKAFANINSAMEDVANFRREALPQMATLIGELDAVSAQAEEAVQKMEKGNRSRPDIIDLPENKMAA